nr:phospholipase-like, aminotransferase-like mobile domain protein [Tanacetum cinerariifolium]
MKDRLGLDRCVLFRSTYFERWLDLTYVKHEEDLIHYMFQKQKVSDNDHYDLPLIYNVNGHTLHFGRREFCLITGFKFGFNSFRKFREGDISFRDRVFLEKIGEYVKSIDLLSVIEDEERFTGLSDEDYKSLSLLSLEVIFMGHELGYAVDDVFLRMVDNLEAWNVFPWGEHIWRELYTAIRYVNSKHKDAHHKALEIKPNFVILFFVWICLVFQDKVESVGKQCDLGDKCWSDQDGDFFTYIGSPNQTSNKDAVNDLVDAFDDLVDANAKLKEVDKDLSQNNQEEVVNVLRTPMEVDTKIKGPSIDTLQNQKNVLYAYMIERCQDLKPWKEVVISINEPNRHWSLAQLHIKSRNVTFYDSQETFDVEIRSWYVKIRRCLESKLPVVLQETGVFVSKGIDPTHYNIKFRHAQNVSKQGGVFDDCGVFVCLFLYMLAHGIPFDVEDPMQTVLAYREKNDQFLFRP